MAGFVENESSDSFARWKGMPSFNQKDLSPLQSISVHFRNSADREAFAKLIDRNLTDKTQSVWYPREEIGRMSDKRFVAKQTLNPQYPVYVISKGRWETRLTSKSLEAIGVPYHIVVEPQERKQYAKVIDPKKILVLPFSNLGQGSIPARNWVWEHSVERGAKRHWILDDNIGLPLKQGMVGFYRLYNNIKTPVRCGNIFRAAEDFVDRYENVAISGFNYFMFASRKSRIIPYYLNTRIYSCILIQNDIPYRWRGRYNEDTDLSIRALKDGWCTVLFNAFLAFKQPTMKMKGGNTDKLYQGDGRLKMAKSLQKQHPDIVKVSRKWGRWQHHVNYKPFRKNRLKLREDAVVEEGVNDYQMYLEIDENLKKS